MTKSAWIGIIITIIIVVAGIVFKAGEYNNPGMSKPWADGARCGGNMANAPKCEAGYHCAPVPGSRLPFGDVGGQCVRD